MCIIYLGTRLVLQAFQLFKDYKLSLTSYLATYICFYERGYRDGIYISRPSYVFC